MAEENQPDKEPVENNEPVKRFVNWLKCALHSCLNTVRRTEEEAKVYPPQDLSKENDQSEKEPVQELQKDPSPDIKLQDQKNLSKAVQMITKIVGISEEKKEDLPPWFQELIPDESVTPEELIAARKEMYDALNLYHIHVKTVMITSFSLVAIIAIFVEADQIVLLTKKPLIAALASAVLATMAWCTYLTINIIRVYYDVYLAAVLYATAIHYRSIQRKSHAWLVEQLELVKRLGEYTKSMRDYYNLRARVETHSHVLYAQVLGVNTGLFALAAGLMVLIPIFSFLAPWCAGFEPFFPVFEQNTSDTEAAIALCLAIFVFTSPVWMTPVWREVADPIDITNLELDKAPTCRHPILILGCIGSVYFTHVIIQSEFFISRISNYIVQAEMTLAIITIGGGLFILVFSLYKRTCKPFVMLLAINCFLFVSYFKHQDDLKDKETKALRKQVQRLEKKKTELSKKMGKNSDVRKRRTK